MPKPLVQVTGVSKKYCRSLKRALWYGLRDVALELSGRRKGELTLRPQEFLAVDDVSFDVHAGESIALIGRNGAGKSTLLKMVNGLIKPDAGQIAIRGRVGALIELGAGFNPLLTGRENIYVNAAVLGMSKREVDKKLDAIIDFAEIDGFVEAPLRTYSSGMKVRLGFAVAAQMQPDVLLIDEVLAVGDAAFRAKCYRRLSDLLESGTAFVLVSHNHHTLLSVCQRGVALDRGAMIASGDIRDALDAYDRRTTATAPSVVAAPPRSTSGDVRITDVYFVDEKSERSERLRTGHPATLRVECESGQEFSNVTCAVVIREALGASAPALALASGQDDCWGTVPVGSSRFSVKFPAMGLRAGDYVAKISLSRKPLFMLDMVEDFRFRVEPGRTTGDSKFYQPRCWAAPHPHVKVA